MSNQEAIEKIKLAMANLAGGTQEELDSFVNGMEYCLALLEGRTPNYRKRARSESQNNTEENN